MQSEISKIQDVLSQKDDASILISTHKSPDGDALGSSLALFNLLNQLDHEVTVVSPNDYPSFLDWMPDNDQVMIYSEEEEKVKKITESADIIFLLDLNSLDRLGDYQHLIRRSTATKIIIDHHQDPDTNEADIIISDVNTSSTSELLYEVIIGLGHEDLINKQISECIYVGIMTDTGSFKYPSTSARTHDIISDIINKGVNNAEIHDLIYDTYSQDRMRLLGYCINEKLLVFKDYRSAIISLSQEELERFRFKKGDTEGVVNYALAIEGIVFAVFITEKEGLIKMSFRSKGNFKVNKIAKKYFNGGGHVNAAGGISDYDLEETIIKLKQIFKTYKKELLI